MPKAARDALRIDGEAMAEPDYRFHHPSMLYELAGWTDMALCSRP